MFEVKVRREELEKSLKAVAASTKASKRNETDTSYVLFQLEEGHNLSLSADDYTTRTKSYLTCEEIKGSGGFQIEASKLLKLLSTIEEGRLITFMIKDGSWELSFGDSVIPFPPKSLQKHLMYGQKLEVPSSGGVQVSHKKLLTFLSLALRFMNSKNQEAMFSVAEVRGGTLLAGDTSKYVCMDVGIPDMAVKFNEPTLENVLEFLRSYCLSVQPFTVCVEETDKGEMNKGYIRHDASGALIQFAIPEEKFPPAENFLRDAKLTKTVTFDKGSLEKSIVRLRTFLMPTMNYLNYSFKKVDEKHFMHVTGKNVDDVTISDKFVVASDNDVEVEFALKVIPLKESLSAIPDNSIRMEVYSDRRTVVLSPISEEEEIGAELKISIVMG